MRMPRLFVGLLLAALLPLRAGSVVTLGDSPEANGKLTLNPSTLHVEGSSGSDINLPDILEANFSDIPFQLDYFSSVSTPDRLPETWKAMTVGSPDMTGNFTYTNGVFTLNAGAGNLNSRDDTVFFVGQPWTGDGEWTMRLTEVDGQNQSEGGLMVRQSLDTKAPSAAVGTTGLLPPEGWSTFRGKPEDSASIQGFSLDLPVWMRLTRNGSSVAISTSGDGNAWSTIYQGFGQMASNSLAGIFFNSNRPKTLGKGIMDQVTFTPRAALSVVLPAGVLLRSGSFIAGNFNPLDFDPNNLDAPGNFTRNGKNVVVPRSKISAVAITPTPRKELASVESQVGFLMQNGDFLAGDPEAINGGGVRISSLLLGVLSYSRSEVRACSLRPLQPQAAAYEVRLTDGSIIRASGLSVKDSRLVIDDISGIEVEVGPEEIAQFRAGSALVQSLLDLPYKATPPSAWPAKPVPPASNPAPAAAPPPTRIDTQPVQCWTGPNQEQLLMATAGTMIDFPLNGKYRALAMRIAFSPDTPLNSQASIRILADGREVGRTPPFRAGDQTRFVEMALQSPQTVTLVADSVFAGTKVLFIDPVVIRDAPLTSP